MLSKEQIIERMARAIYCPTEKCSVRLGELVSYEGQETRTLIRKQAEAALNALLECLPGLNKLDESNVINPCSGWPRDCEGSYEFYTQLLAMKGK